MKKVLLASASRVFLNRNTTLLRQRGFQLFTATNGIESLELHEEHHFDLILSDVKLDDLDGCTFCSLVREKENEHHIPIILFCHNSPNSMDRIVNSGVSAMLIKPIEPVQLLEAIACFIDFQMVRSKRVMLKVKVLSKSPDREFICFSHDISKTGILLETLNELALGCRIICKFTLPDASQVEIHGEVTRALNTWECSNLYGVKFINMSASHRNAIINYVSSAEESRTLSETVIYH